jgi:hypothetical protein
MLKGLGPFELFSSILIFLVRVSDSLNGVLWCSTFFSYSKEAFYEIFLNFFGLWFCSRKTFRERDFDLVFIWCGCFAK